MTSPAPPARAALVASVADAALCGRSTLLVAPSGAGRTIALQHIAEAVRLREPAVRRFTATSGTAATPYGLFLGVLDAAGNRRLSALDGLGRIALLRAAVLELGLKVVVVDEAPLADPESAGLLLELAESGAAVVAGATTGRTLPDAVRTLFADPAAATTALPALTAADTTALAVEVLGGPVDGALASALLRASSGLPAALIELLGEGRRIGAIQRSSDLWVLAQDLPPLAAVQRRVADRWPLLTPAQQTWLAQVAFAGSVADDLAARLADDAVADWAEQATWTVHRDGRTSLRTAAVRGAVLRQLGARARAATARTLLTAQDGLGRPLHRAERLAAVRCRLELNEVVDLDSARAVAEEFGLADGGPAERLLRAAVERDGGASARTTLAAHLAAAGRAEDALPVLDEAQGGDARRLRAGLTGYVDGDPDTAIGELAAPEDEEGAALRVGLLRLAGRTAASLEAARELRSRTAGPIAAEATLHEALALIDLGDAAGALEAAERLRAARDALRGLPGGGSSADWIAGRVAVELRLHTDDRLTPASHELARLEPQLGARAPFAHLLGRIALLRGDPFGAAQWIREAAAAPGIWVRSRRPALLADLAIALALGGDPSAAEARLPDGRLAPAHRPRVLLARAAIATARQDPAAAAQLAEEAAAAAAATGRLLDETDARWDAVRFGSAGAARRFLALPPLDGAGRALQRRHAEAVLTGAVDALEASALALHDAGLVLWAIEASAVGLRARAAEGRPDPAAVGRAAEWLAAAPGLVLPVDQARRLSTLTARERQVAQLAATGLPDRAVADRLGIALRTAQTHLGRAYGKLGVHRRTELQDALDRA